MTESDAANPKRKIFISYSHQPTENADFVRAQAQRLKRTTYKGIGFDVWLDEERIAGAADVEGTLRQAVLWADAALFVVTSRWSERERSWIRMEVSLMGKRENTRLVALLRESIEADLLDHTFTTLKHLEWFPEDKEPDARFWEVFCGLTGEMPGPRSEWARMGREISGESDSLGPQLAEETQTEPVKLPIAGRPDAVFPGEKWTYLLTDRGEWTAVDTSGRARAPIHPPCSYSAAMVSDGNELLLAAYDGTIARYTGRSWRTMSQPAPVLCLASSPQGELVGTSSGHILLLRGDSFEPVLRVRDPVVSLVHYENGVLVIGAQGTFGRIPLPVRPQSQLEWLEAREIGRCFGFFQPIDSTQIGLIGAAQLGVYTPESGKIAVCPKAFDEGIRRVEFLGAQTWPYAVLTDAGGIVLVDAGMSRTRDVRLPGTGAAMGCTRAGLQGSLLAWTTDGKLYLVSPSGGVENIADGDVVMAYSLAGDAGMCALRWTSEAGASAQIVRIG